ncbi:hypothetical protein GCM10009609_23630 [Pseudonocardia aurantiaca]|uniref:hypothetical protein n=1 Tax=Pseudonocardia aurantiaca TaxID=75290 RepID=UPI0031DF91E1
MATASATAYPLTVTIHAAVEALISRPAASSGSATVTADVDMRARPKRRPTEPPRARDGARSENVVASALSVDTAFKQDERGLG